MVIIIQLNLLGIGTSNGDYSTSSMDAAVIGEDFENVDSVITFQPGETTKTVTAEVYKDNKNERTEWFNMNIEVADNGGNETLISKSKYGLYINNVISNNSDDGDASFEIEGIAEVGKSLTIKESSSDPDGTGTLNYSWQTASDGNNWTEVSNKSTYQIISSDKGKSIKAVISYTDGEGFKEIVETKSTIISVPKTLI